MGSEMCIRDRPEVLFGDIAQLSSKSDVYVILFMKLLNCFLFFCDERMIFPRGGGVLPYLGYTGTCCWTGYGFWPHCPKQGIQ